MVEREITQYDSPSPTLDSHPPVANYKQVNSGSTEQAELTAMAQQHRQKRQSANVKVPVKVKEDEPWFTRFKHLAKGLYNLDSTNTGMRFHFIFTEYRGPISKQKIRLCKCFC